MNLFRDNYLDIHRYLEVVQAIVVDETVKLSARARTRLVIYDLRINRDIGESA